MLRDNNPLNPSRLGRPQNGAEIPGILHTIEDQEKGGFTFPFRQIEEFFNLEIFRSSNEGNHPLMVGGSSPYRQTSFRLPRERNPLCPGEGEQFTDPSIMAILAEIKVIHIPPASLESLQNGIEADQNLIHPLPTRAKSSHL